MKVRLYAFAGLRELLGQEHMVLDLPVAAKVEDAIEFLTHDFEGVRALAPSLRAAINQEYAERDQLLFENCELALFPPVGGG